MIGRAFFGHDIAKRTGYHKQPGRVYRHAVSEGRGVALVSVLHGPRNRIVHENINRPRLLEDLIAQREYRGLIALIVLQSGHVVALLTMRGRHFLESIPVPGGRKRLCPGLRQGLHNLTPVEARAAGRKRHFALQRKSCPRSVHDYLLHAASGGTWLRAPGNRRYLLIILTQGKHIAPRFTNGNPISMSS